MHILEIKDLKKSYASPDGEILQVIDVPEFALERGGQLALRGESGSGKTTFLNLIAGILRPDGGRIYLDGEDVTALPEPERDRRRADKIGYIFQTFNLLQGYTAFENVLLGMMFGKGIDKELALTLLERVGLEDRVDYKPGQLSVGQQQRVAVARALAGRPALVLADEPTGNLDFKTAGAAASLIREVCAENGAALLLVSHDAGILGGFENVRELKDINRLQYADERGRNG